MIFNVILFHPRRGLFFSAMNAVQLDRWRRHHGFVVASWCFKPSDDETLSLLQYLSISLLGQNDWARIFDDLAKTFDGAGFKCALRQTSRELKQGQPIEKAIRKVLPDRLSTSILSSYKRGQVAQEIEKIFESYLKEVEDRSKRTSKKMYPIALVLSLVGLVIMVDIQFVPVLCSLFSSYGISPPAIIVLFNGWVQVSSIVGILAVVVSLRSVYQRLPFLVKASIPLLGQLRAIQLNTIMIDAYQEALLRECAFNAVLQERFELQRDRFLQYGISTVVGRLQQGVDLTDAMKEIPQVRGWGGTWTTLAAGSSSDRVSQGINAYQRRFRQQEEQLKDTIQNIFVGALIGVVAAVIAILGYLMTLPLQYADKLI